MFQMSASIEFLNKKPDSEQVQYLNYLMRNFDPGFPLLTEDGFTGQCWEQPLLSLDEALNVLHVLGYPCRGMRYNLLLALASYVHTERWVYCGANT